MSSCCRFNSILTNANNEITEKCCHKKCCHLEDLAENVMGGRGKDGIYLRISAVDYRDFPC